MSARPRVMQSFRAPRPTTNPYIVQLDRALSASADLEHVRFSWRGALFQRVDVLHFHWPEVLIEGRSGWRRLAKRTLLRAVLLKARATGTTILRTVHNVELPKDANGATRRLLLSVDARTDFRIVLNPHTPGVHESASRLIPHGHYIDWYADAPRVKAADSSLGFVGLIRRYKGVEDLIRAFASTSDEAPELRLQISGSPTSLDIADEVRALAAEDARVQLDLRFLSDVDFATAVMSSRGVALPYRFMHNSGTALASLSLSRPVLVPRNDVNDALGSEVGPGWVHVFEGELTPDDLIRFHRALSTPPAAEPRLDARDWSRTAAEHAAAYRSAVRIRRDRRRRGRDRGQSLGHTSSPTPGKSVDQKAPDATTS